MIRTDSPRSSVFCDWLDVTAPPDHEDRLRRAIGPLLCAADGLKIGSDLYDVGGGKVKLHNTRGVFRCSFSGASIRLLEGMGYWDNVLAEVGTGPHRVTRVDAAMDLAFDGALAIAQLREAYPRDYVRLGQRAIRVQCILQARDSDGLLTGTWYAGHRSGAEVTARVYDKAAQMLAKHDVDLAPTTRVELTVRKGATLRDVAQPTRIFWHYIAPAILPLPDGIPAWDSGWAEGWHMNRVEVLPAQMLRRRIDHSPDLAALIELADSLGPHGRQLLVSWLTERVRPQDAGSLPVPLRAHGSD